LVGFANIPLVEDKAGGNLNILSPEDFRQRLADNLLTSEEKFEDWESFFPTYPSFLNFKKYCHRIVAVISFFDGQLADVEKKEGSLSGLSFCITGTLSKPRLFFVKLIESEGGTFKDSATKVNYLIVGDSPGNTKITDAKSRNISMISESDFWEMVR